MNDTHQSAEIVITQASEALIPSFHEALDAVAKEQIYIEMIEAKPLEDVLTFQKMLIANDWPAYYAVTGEKVIGWVDITRSSNPRFHHRASLGMGLHKSFRGRGLGSQLLKAALEHARRIGIEKVELSVYTTNKAAIALYKKFGFQEIGIIKHFRKLNGQYFDCLEMELFL